MIDPDQSHKKILPHSLDAESAVIGGILLENSAACDALSILNADGQDFYHAGHRQIFQTMMELIDNGSVADLITVCDKLQNRGILDKVGGHVFVADVMDRAISSANVSYYAEIVKGYAIKRNIINEASKIIAAASTLSSDAAEALEHAQRAILSLSIQKENNTTHTGRDLARQTFSEIEDRHKKGDLITGISTGLHDLDNITLGLNQGDLFIIAGRPGMGKSALAGNIAKNVSMDGRPVAYFSLEMSGKSLMMRLLAGHTNIDSRRLQRGLVGDGQWSKLTNAVSEIANAPLFIDDKPDVSLMEFRAKAPRLKADHGIELLIIDYIQLMRSPGRHDSREQEVAEISRTLKAIARELSIPVIGLSQLNRKVDERPGKRPMLSDLRESGAIEQDADIIAFIYPCPDNDDSKQADRIINLNIAKNRNGVTGDTSLRFNAPTQTFRNYVIER